MLAKNQKLKRQSNLCTFIFLHIKVRWTIDSEACSSRSKFSVITFEVRVEFSPLVHILGAKVEEFFLEPDVFDVGPYFLYATNVKGSFSANTNKRWMFTQIYSSWGLEIK